jgi:hypothetical protein
MMLITLPDLVVGLQRSTVQVWGIDSPSGVTRDLLAARISIASELSESFLIHQNHYQVAVIKH